MVGLRQSKGHRYLDNPILQLVLQNWRSKILVIFLLSGFLALLGRSFFLQVIHNDFLQDKGDSRYLRNLEVSASRGRILDRHGDLLAVSTPMQSIWAIPADAREMSLAQKKELSAQLDVSLKEIDNKLASDRGFVYFKRQVSPEVASRIATLKIPGIQQDKEYRRYYPNGEMTAHLVGFSGVDDKGLEGVELAFQRALQGKSGNRTVIRDRRGSIVEDVGAMRPPQDGKDIALAMDAKIQYLAYSRLKLAIEEHQAKAGGIVVADVRTGEILAMVNSPNYNPNDRVRLTGEQLRNRAITDTFEPGSTMKPFVVAMALDKGSFRYDTLINCAPGKMTIGNATISDAHAYGQLSVAQVIQKSSNIGTAKIGLTFPPREMWEMFDSLGFGRMPQLGFPGEVSGRLRPWKGWQPIEQATMSYGHGISVSLLQLARAYTVFGRQGDLISLRLEKHEEPVVYGQSIYSAQTVREMRAMLEMVTAPGGTAPRAQVPGYRVGGKSGTAYKLEAGQYAKKYIASFVGLAPMSDPRLVVAVMIDEPSVGTHFGGGVAGPVFSDVMGGALRTLGVVPDALPNERKGL